MNRRMQIMNAVAAIKTFSVHTALLACLFGLLLAASAHAGQGSRPELDPEVFDVALTSDEAVATDQSRRRRPDGSRRSGPGHRSGYFASAATRVPPAANQHARGSAAGGALLGRLRAHAVLRPVTVCPLRRIALPGMHLQAVKMLLGRVGLVGSDVALGADGHGPLCRAPHAGRI